MEDGLAKRGRSLEEMFFMQRDAELIAQRKKLEEMAKTKEALSQVSGIRDAKVLDRLVELEVSPAVLASLVVLPLVEVAWADGKLSAEEKAAVLDGAAKAGLAKGSTNYALLESWLKERPSPKFLEAWLSYIQGLKQTMDAKSLGDLKQELMGRAQKVANASGGFLGMSKVSPEEAAVLKKMESAFTQP